MMPLTSQAWTGPTATAPNNNASAPLNVSATAQTKGGDLGVNNFTANGNMQLFGQSNPDNTYLLFGSGTGSNAYGLWDNNGTIEYKNSGGTWSTFSGSLTSSGTSGYIPRFTSSTALGNSSITSDGNSATANGNFFVTNSVQIGNGTAAPYLTLDGYRPNTWAANQLAFGDELNSTRYIMNERGTNENVNAPWTFYYYNTANGNAWQTLLGIYPTSLNAATYTETLHDGALTIDPSGNTKMSGNLTVAGGIIPAPAASVSNTGGGSWFLGNSVWSGNTPAITNTNSTTGIMYGGSGASGSQLFTLSSNSGQSSLQLDGSIFVGDGITYNPAGIAGNTDGSLVAAGSGAFGGNLYSNGSIFSNGQITVANALNLNSNQLWTNSGNLYLNWSSSSGNSVVIGGQGGYSQNLNVPNGNLCLNGSCITSWPTAYNNTDTLDTVTGRGNTTGNWITVGSLTSTGNTFSNGNIRVNSQWTNSGTLNMNSNQVWQDTGYLYLNFSSPSGDSVIIGGQGGNNQSLSIPNGNLCLNGSCITSWPSTGSAFTGSGTAGTIPRYTGGTALGNSSIVSDGNSATANGNFTVTSNLYTGGNVTVNGNMNLTGNLQIGGSVALSGGLWPGNNSSRGYIFGGPVAVYGGFWTNNGGIMASGGNIWATDGTNVAALYSNGAGTFSSYVSATQFLSSSDRRLKKDIAPLTDNLAKVLAIQPVSYQWIDPSRGTGEQIGFIAQDVQKIAPMLVHTDASTTLESIDYARTTPLLVGSVQELNQKITDQQAQISEQQKEIDTLRAAIQVLEQKL